MTKNQSRTTKSNIALLYIEEGQRDTVDQLFEFDHLVGSNNFHCVFCVRFLVRKPSPATFIQKGQLALLADLMSQASVSQLVVSRPLGARIQRNIEKALCISILDRTELLLQLFEMRAVSATGKLQVELAKLTYMSTKLVRGWTHLERQRGGIGLRGGPGETQIEVDRRIIREKMHVLQKKLASVSARQALNRKQRVSNRVPVVALVGYTNAGKSSLFNRLTGASTHVQDQLFATLDPLTRQAKVDQQTLLFIDTVGFMRELPPALMTAFKATLEEIRYADLLLIVVDASEPFWSDRLKTVQTTLSELGAEAIPHIVVSNKMDLACSIAIPGSHPVSTTSGQGLDSLKRICLARLR